MVHEESCCTLCNGLNSNALRNVICKNELSHVALVKDIWCSYLKTDSKTSTQEN